MNINGTENGCYYRDAACFFAGVGTEKLEKQSNVPDCAAESRPDFMSLVMPCFDSATLHDIESYGCGNYHRRPNYKGQSLDDYCNPGLERETLFKRNRDQVLVRHRKNQDKTTKKPNPQTHSEDGLDMPDSTPKVIMVSQLWLWKIDDFVVSQATYSLSGCYRFNEPYRSEIPKHFRSPEHFQSPENPGYAVDMAIGELMADYINRLDNPRAMGLTESIFHIFGKSISRVSEDVKKYLRDANMENISIKKEKRYLHEISDIREELSMIKTVILQQEEVWTEFSHGAWPWCWPNGRDGRCNISPKNAEKASVKEKEIWSKIARAPEQLRKYKGRIAKLDEDAERVERSVLTQLDLKAKHAGLRETHTASLMGAAVVGFTIVTIIFTPLSFLVGLFALPIDRFQQNQSPSSGSGSGSNTYSSNYIGTWMTLAELAALAVTAFAVWVALEGIMNVRITKAMWKSPRRIYHLGGNKLRAKRAPDTRRGAEKDAETEDESESDDSDTEATLSPIFPVNPRLDTSEPNRPSIVQKLRASLFKKRWSGRKTTGEDVELGGQRHDAPQASFPPGSRFVPPGYMDR